MADKKIEITATTGLMLGNALVMCAEVLDEVLAEISCHDIGGSAVARLANAVEFIGGVGRDFAKHAKELNA
jgi:hypothetical protein